MSAQKHRLLHQNNAKQTPPIDPGPGFERIRLEMHTAFDCVQPADPPTAFDGVQPAGPPTAFDGVQPPGPPTAFDGVQPPGPPTAFNCVQPPRPADDVLIASS